MLDGQQNARLQGGQVRKPARRLYLYARTFRQKLLFMGQEFGQEREWSEARELDWFLLQNELNQGLQDYVAELLKLYRKYPCMYEIDNSWDGFEWINADDADRSTYSFIRKTSGEKTKRLLLY